MNQKALQVRQKIAVSQKKLEKIQGDCEHWRHKSIIVGEITGYLQEGGYYENYNLWECSNCGKPGLHDD